jgi:hypothetical protein
MNINLQVIPPSQMRPEVDGADWFWDSNGDLQVRVCPMSDSRMEIALMLHEAFEALLCHHDGVTQKQVDEFDQKYDLTHETDVEAGDDPNAPYKVQHSLATAVERIYTAHVGLDWKTYDDELNATYPGPSHKPEGHCQ